MVEKMLSIVQFLIAFILLVIASWQDINKREVDDWIWIIMIVGGIFIHILQIFFLIVNNESILSYFSTWIINIIFSFTIALFLTASNLSGEADRIAFIAIGIILPISLPVIILIDSKYEILYIIVPRIFGTFCNAYLVALPVPLFILGFNIINQFIHPSFYTLKGESVWKKILIRFIGYPRHTISLEKDLMNKPWHYDFLEEFNDELGWQIVFRTSLDTPENDIVRKEEIISLINAKNKKFVWIQPSLPFIFILMIGFLAEILIGNILFIGISFLL